MFLGHDLLKLNCFIHTLELEVLIPFIFERFLSPYIKKEKFLGSYPCKRAKGFVGSVMGVSVVSHGIFGINYYGYIKKSRGLTDCLYESQDVPVLNFSKIPNDILLKYSRTKITNNEIETYRDGIKKILDGGIK